MGPNANLPLNRAEDDKREAEQRFIEALDEAEFLDVDVEFLVCRKLFQRDRDKMSLWAFKGSVIMVWLWVLSWYPLQMVAAYLKLPLPAQDWLGWTCAMGFVSLLGTGVPGLVQMVQAALAARSPKVISNDSEHTSAHH
ncbi:MAG: hypothetical protein K2W95_15800 [Candidatus Obscuribacterales bacterium]|nr:hypothetical protein [Candidatus Obscuribacterales bacterium]